MTGQREVFTPSQNTSLQRLTVSAPKILPPRQPVGAADLLSSPTPDLRVNEIFRSQCRQTGLSLVLRRPQRSVAACIQPGVLPSRACRERSGHPYGLWDKDLGGAFRAPPSTLVFTSQLCSSRTGCDRHTPRPSPPDTGRGTPDLLPPLGEL